MANQQISGMGVHHIALRCSDLERSLQFYCQGLGFVQLYAWGEGDGRICMVDVGDGAILEMFAAGKDTGVVVPESEAGKFFHLAFRVDDVQQAYDRALASGAKSKAEPKVIPIQAQPHDITLNAAFVYGPDGEVLEFFKML